VDAWASYITVFTFAHPSFRSRESPGPAGRPCNLVFNFSITLIVLAAYSGPLYNLYLLAIVYVGARSNL